ncbi:MAG: peptidoglycan-binding domain-containing protein [bacterium]
MNKKFTKIVAVVVGLTMAFTMVATVSAQSMNMSQLIDLLIATGVIAPEKAAAARAAVGGTTVTTTATSGYKFTSEMGVGAKGAQVTALQQALGITPATGYFGAITKAAVVKFQSDNGIKATGYVGPMTMAALNKMGGSVTTTIPGTGAVVIPVTGSATVSTAMDTPTPITIPEGASQVPFTKINFTAGATDLVVTALKVTRGGFSSDNDINNVYLMDGSTVLATNIGLANGKAMFSMANGLFTVKAGTTKTITIAADLNSNTSTHSFSFGIAAAADITSNAVVGGAFPIAGYASTAGTVANPALATLLVTNVATGGTVNAGQTNFLAGQFSMQSSNSAVSIKSIKLTETGTINAASDLSNIRLMNGGVQIGNTVPNLNSDGTVVFDLSNNPLQITAGNTVNLTLYVDVVGGVNRNMRFTVQRSYDIVSTDMTYNVGAAISATGGFPVQASVVGINYGTLVINKNTTSPSNYIASGANNQTLASFDFKANGEAVRLSGITYQLSYSSAVETAVWDNLKLVDDQGVQIGNIIRSAGDTNTSQSVVVENLNYVIPANTTRTFSVKADVKGAGTALTAQITSGVAQGYTSLVAINFNSYVGNPLSLASSPLVASLNNAQGAVTTVTGTANVKVGSFSVVAGPAEGANLISLTVTTGAGISSVYQNMRLMIGNQTIGTAQTVLANATAYTFTASPLVAIAKGASVVVDVYADVISGQTISATRVVSLTGVSAQGADTSTNLTPSTNVGGQLVTVAGNGTLTTSIASTPVNSQFVSMGLSNVKVGSFKLTASNNEPIKVITVGLTATTTSSTGSELTNIRLMNGQTVIAQKPSFGAVASGVQTATFQLSGNELVVPKDGYVTMDVVADINNIDGGAVSAVTITVGLSGVSAQGAASMAAANDTDLVRSNATFTVYRTNLRAVANFPASNASMVVGDALKTAAFNFSADVGNDASIKTISVRNTGSMIKAGASASSSVAVTVYAADDLNTSIGTGTLVGTTATSITLSPNFTVTKSTTRGLVIKSNLGSATDLDLTSGSVRTYQIGLSALTWNDGTSDVSSVDPSISMPINAEAISFQQ